MIRGDILLNSARRRQNTSGKVGWSSLLASCPLLRRLCVPRGAGRLCLRHTIRDCAGAGNRPRRRLLAQVEGCELAYSRMRLGGSSGERQQHK